MGGSTLYPHTHSIHPSNPPSTTFLSSLPLLTFSPSEDDDKDDDGPDLGEEIQPDLDDIGVGVFPPEVGLTEPGTIVMVMVMVIVIM